MKPNERQSPFANFRLAGDSPQARLPRAGIGMFVLALGLFALAGWCVALFGYWYLMVRFEVEPDLPGDFEPWTERAIGLVGAVAADVWLIYLWFSAGRPPRRELRTDAAPDLDGLGSDPRQRGGATWPKRRSRF